MRHIKRLVPGGFLLLWLAGFLLTAPAPLYRWLYLRANQLPLETPHQLFEGMDWSHPYYYADVGRAFRDLTQQAPTDTIYLYLDPASDLNTDAYRRYFSEYATVWAYPKTVERTGNLVRVPQGAAVIVSSTAAPDADCQAGEENLFLCQS